MRGPVIGEEANENGDDDVGDGHEECTPEEEDAAAEAVHCPDTGHDADQLGYVEDTGHEELHVVV